MPIAPGEPLTWLAAAFVALAAIFVVLVWRVRRAHEDLRRRLKAVLANGEDASLEQVLDRTFTRLDRLERRVDAVNSLQRETERLLGGAIQRVGLVRYNPFPETGGDQSFVVALLDRMGDGVVFTSLHGRTDTRIYAKPVRARTSTYSLSAEEEEAIRRAMAGP